MRNTTPLNGDAKKTSNALGIAPIYGPKNGMILVTPTSTLINAVYGILAILRAIKVMIATMIESMIFPLKNLAKDQLMSFPKKSYIKGVLPVHRTALFPPSDKSKR